MALSGFIAAYFTADACIAAAQDWTGVTLKVMTQYANSTKCINWNKKAVNFNSCRLLNGSFVFEFLFI